MLPTYGLAPGQPQRSSPPPTNHLSTGLHATPLDLDFIHGGLRLHRRRPQLRGSACISTPSIRVCTHPLAVDLCRCDLRLPRRPHQVRLHPHAAGRRLRSSIVRRPHPCQPEATSSPISAMVPKYAVFAALNCCVHELHIPILRFAEHTVIQHSLGTVLNVPSIEFFSSCLRKSGTCFAPLNLGGPQHNCTHCGAFFWYQERIRRDHHGGFLAGACHFFSSVPDPERAEILACKRALELAKEMGVDKVCLESDCLSAVAELSSNEKDLSLHGPLIEEIKFLLQGFADHLVRHVRRSGLPAMA